MHGSNGLFQALRWTVAEHGYQWVTGLPMMHGWEFNSTILDEPALIALEQGGAAESIYRVSGRSYSPMEVSGLHRRFAEVKPTMAGVMEFCARFGPLGRQPVRLMDRVGGVPRKVHPVLRSHLNVFGESLSFWTYHVTKVGTLLRVRAALQSRCPSAALLNLQQERPPISRDCLREVWEDTEAPPPPPPPGYRLLPLMTRTGLRQSVTPYNFRLALEVAWQGHDPCHFTPDTADQFLTVEVNKELRAGCYPQLTHGGSSRMQLRPVDLLGAIYMHLSLDLADQLPPTMKCPACGEWFEQAHRRQKYCEEKCRAKAYRGRMARAKHSDNGGGNTE